MESKSNNPDENDNQNQNEDEDDNQNPEKKFLDEKKDKNDIEDIISIATNLSHLKLNPKAIKGIYLYGCDIEQENQIQEYNQVNIMRKARKLKCFQERIKLYVPDYYISGLILMGRPKNDSKETKKFKFYLLLKELEDRKTTGEILDELPENEVEGKIYKFRFKRKKKDLLEMKEGDKPGESECVANYLNICLGKILKKCGYTKDRSTRKILYYNKEDAQNAEIIEKTDFLFFPALKAVCETYEGGKIYMKLLPKRLLKNKYTYADYFYSIKSENNNIEEILKIFKTNVINKRGIKVYDQAFMKIENVIFENPYKIFFTDKKNQKMSVGDYYTNHLNIKLNQDKIPVAVRYIDKGGKLKGKDILEIHVPCFLLEIIGNIFGDTINIKKLVQSPFDKLDEIKYIRNLIEKNATNTSEEELHNYLGNKFEPLTISGQIIRPPLIIFDKDKKVETSNGSFELFQTTPYSKVKELKKIDIYLLDLDNNKGEFIWQKLKDASKELGISFKEEATFYQIDSYNDSFKFENYIYNYFEKVDEYYKDKKNETDFIFMFMDSRKKTHFHYRIFKSIINKFNWIIPTQVILFDERKFSKKTNLSQFTNILCQMWAKKGNELYICDFGFIPKTMVIAYSSMVVQDKKVLTSISISIGVKLYEYMFFSTIEENKNNDSRISPSIQPLLTNALVAIGKHLKKNIEHIVIYRDAVNEKQQKSVKQYEIDSIKKAIKGANEKLDNNIFTDTKWCLILVSKINEVKMFYESYNGGNNNNAVSNIPVGTIVDRVITNKDKYDFYLNSAESRQGTSSSTHYIILYDDTTLTAMQIYKLTYYLTYLSYNTTHSIRVPAPLYFVTRRNKFTSENLKGDVINPKLRTLNISL